MKKILTFILTAAMLLSVSACNSQESGNMKGKHVLKDLADAREKVYAEVRKISCDNLFYRNDIAHLAFE